MRLTRAFLFIGIALTGCDDGSQPTQPVVRTAQSPLFYEEPASPEGFICPASVPLTQPWTWQGGTLGGMHVYARIKPEIMRQFYIPTPYSLQGENISDGKKYCYYSHSNRGISTENDWEVTGGQIVLQSRVFGIGGYALIGDLHPVRYDGSSANFKRIYSEEEDEDCDGVYEDDEVVDPNEPCDEGGPGGTGGEDHGLTCTSEPVVIEIDPGDGIWRQGWSGMALVCQ